MYFFINGVFVKEKYSESFKIKVMLLKPKKGGMFSRIWKLHWFRLKRNSGIVFHSGRKSFQRNAYFRVGFHGCQSAQTFYLLPLAILF